MWIGLIRRNVKTAETAALSQRQTPLWEKRPLVKAVAIPVHPLTPEIFDLRLDWNSPECKEKTDGEMRKNLWHPVDLP